MNPSDNEALLVLRIAKRCEAVLREQYAATGNGLHALLTSVESDLSKDEIWAIRVIASIRNKIAHEDGFENLDSYTKKRFYRACANLEQFLGDLAGDDKNNEYDFTESEQEKVKHEKVWSAWQEHFRSAWRSSNSEETRHRNASPKLHKSTRYRPWYKISDSVRIRPGEPDDEKLQILPDGRIRFGIGGFGMLVLTIVAVIVFVKFVVPVLGLLLIGFVFYVFLVFGWHTFKLFKDD